MRRTFVVVMFMSVSGFAPPASSETECEAMGRLAENVMKLRQQEKPLTVVLKQVVGATSDEAVKPLIRFVILEAYARPAFSVEENKTLAVAKFRNDIEFACLQNPISP